MTEHRCPKCKKLLFKADINSAYIEIKCDKCGKITKLCVNHVKSIKSLPANTEP